MTCRIVKSVYFFINSIQKMVLVHQIHSRCISNFNRWHLRRKASKGPQQTIRLRGENIHYIMIGLEQTFCFNQDYHVPSMKIRLSWMAIGREKKQMLINTPLTFLKWWSSLILKTFIVFAETIPSPSLFHSSQILLANLNFPTSKRYLFLNSLKLVKA